MSGPGVAAAGGNGRVPPPRGTGEWGVNGVAGDAVSSFPGWSILPHSPPFSPILRRPRRGRPTLGGGAAEGTDGAAHFPG